MADKPLPWFRLYSEIISDRKIAMIARLSGRSKAEIIGAFTILMCLASESPDRGVLLATENVLYSIADIAAEFGLDEQETQEILEYFQKLEMLQVNDDKEISIRNWDKRQYKSDDSNERVTRYRQNRNQNVTPPLQGRYSNAEVTPPDNRVQITDTEDREQRAEDNVLDSFSLMRQLIEKFTGYPIPNNKAEVQAINEMVELAVIEDDIRAAIQFFRDNEKTARGASSLLNSVKYARSKRIQSANTNGRKATGVTVETDKAVWADEYFKDHPNG